MNIVKQMQMKLIKLKNKKKCDQNYFIEICRLMVSLLKKIQILII